MTTVAPERQSRAAGEPRSAAQIALCLEQTLGHRAHGLNLERACEASEQPIDVLHVDFPERPRLRVPWALRGSFDAYRQLRAAPAYDVTFFHTQTVALLASRATSGRRYAVGVDATPVQLDEMGRWYQHAKSPGLLEQAKLRWYRSVFRAAAGVVTWSHWAARSAVEDYGASQTSLLVAHPGARRELHGVRRDDKPGHRPRILFIGGDFERKGGDSLLRVFRTLSDRAELVLVTEAPVQAEPGVEVLTNIRPGTEEQAAAFAGADIFCLPTLGDCTPVAIGEAMSAGLPVVTTAIGSNPEWVPDDVGMLVPPADDAALATALTALVDDAELRQRRSSGARAWAQQHMDAERNAARVIDFLTGLAEPDA